MQNRLQPVSSDRLSRVYYVINISVLIPVISVRLTARYIGERQAKNLEILGRADLMAFTFDGGVFCDTREKLCRDDKYFGTDGKRSGKINNHFTEILFGK